MNNLYWNVYRSLERELLDIRSYTLGREGYSLLKGTICILIQTA